MEKIICKICLKEFNNFRSLTQHIRFLHKITSKEYYLKYISGKNKCKICGKETKFKNINIGFNKYCSNKCQLKDPDMIKVLSSDQRREKLKNTYKNYDFTERNNKSKKTKLLKYGHKNYRNDDKIKETRLKKQYEKKILKNVNIEPLFTFNEFRDIYLHNANGLRDVNNLRIKFNFKCKICNAKFNDYLSDGHIAKCPICNPPLNGTSNSEKKLQDFIKSLNLKSENNKRFFENNKYKYELDCFIPEKNIGIEFDGLYWHSELSGNKDRNYHLDKNIFFSKKGYNILHIFENEWLTKQEIVKSVIKSKLGITENRIYARKCEIREVNNKEKNLFLNENHLQGEDRSKVKLGLYYDNELVSLLTLGKPRFNKKYHWEIIRFSNKLNISVIGGFSKLLKRFRKENNGSIITYADKRYSNGDLYKNNGFTELHDSKPNYFYVKNNIIFSREKFQKHKLNNLLENFNSELTEWENMQLNNYDRIWDCGNKVFVLK
jgi:endogenous inhibitor of DNA gyrase (YacG/DUF329 family)